MVDQEGPAQPQGQGDIRPPPQQWQRQQNAGDNNASAEQAVPDGQPPPVQDGGALLPAWITPGVPPGEISAKYFNYEITASAQEQWIRVVLLAPVSACCHRRP